MNIKFCFLIYFCTTLLHMNHFLKQKIMNAKNLFRIVCSTLVAGALLFTACKKESKAFKESTNPDENYRNIMTQAKEINEYTLADMQTYTPATQQLLFGSMTPESRIRIVNERIDYAIYKESNPISIQKLTNLKSMLSVANYYNDTPNKAQILAVESYVETNMVTYFGLNKTKMIVSSWGGEGSGMISGGATSKCSCSSESPVWCVLLGSKCTANADNCQKVGKCGILWQYECDGMCTLGVSSSTGFDFDYSL